MNDVFQGVVHTKNSKEGTGFTLALRPKNKAKGKALRSGRAFVHDLD